MELTIEVVGLIMWLLTIFLIFGSNKIGKLIGCLLHVYVATYLMSTYGTIFGFGEFIIVSYVITIIGFLDFTYSMVRKI